MSAAFLCSEPVPESRVVDEGSIIGGHVVIPAPRVALQLQEVKLDLDHLARGGGDHPGAVGVVEIGIRMDRRPDIINTYMYYPTFIKSMNFNVHMCLKGIKSLDTDKPEFKFQIPTKSQ